MKTQDMWVSPAITCPGAHEYVAGQLKNRTLSPRVGAFWPEKDLPASGSICKGFMKQN
jgi:hypothetical protein